MVKSDYRGICRLPLSCDGIHISPSLPSNLADSSQNDIDPSDLYVTPDSVGISSDGNGGDAAVDDGGSGSSSPLSSSTIPDLELDHSHHRVNPEDSPTPNLQRLRLVSSVHSPTTTEDDVLIMDGVLVDNGPDNPSNARRSVSFVHNGLGNRRSASMSDLILVSSSFQGSRDGGSSRRSGYSGQFYQRRDREEPRGAQPQRNRYYEGSSNRWQAGPFNLQHGQQFPLPAHTIQQGQQQLSFSYPYNMQLPQHQQYPFHMNMTPPPPYLSPWQPGPRASYTYAPAAVTVQPSAHYNYNQPSGSSGVFPVDIRRPDGTPLTLPPAQPAPAPPRRPVAPLVISTPPANGGRAAPAPERPETQPPAPRVAGAAAPRAPSARAFSWPPTVEEESAIWYALHDTGGNRRRARLPVFRGICSDGTEGQAPPPPPAPPRP